MGATRTDINAVVSKGPAAWLDAQFALPASPTRWDMMVAAGWSAPSEKNFSSGIDATNWKKLLNSPDTLRQRVTLALSEIVVASLAGFAFPWNTFSGAAYMDILEANAFGNYRTLIEQISFSAPMAEYLTYRDNRKAANGSLPDENYAREIMQLFTIGLIVLNNDGTPKLSGGAIQETYGLDDITGLARVFTGFDYDLAGKTQDESPEYKRRPMAVNASRHELGEKTFLGQTIPAGTTAVASVKKAIDVLFAHPNVAPFIGKQLIQRLVTSNPSPAYVARISAVFNNDGKGVKGNLQAVVRAILLDTEANSDAGLTSTTFGKLREPMLRVTAWGRAFNVYSSNGKWDIKDTSDPSYMIGQAPMRSPSVFNYFRPGYVPPSPAFAGKGLVAPEFQITNETTVVGYLNYMLGMIKENYTGLLADYTPLIAKAAVSQDLIDEINLILAAGQLGSTSVTQIKGALDTMPSASNADKLNRIYVALILVFASSEFLVQK